MGISQSKNAVLREVNNETLFVVSWQDQQGSRQEGPLQILWELIDSYQVDIFDVCLARITHDFLKFLEQKKHLSLEQAIPFVCMSARLLYYKSRALLPDTDWKEAEEPVHLPQELVQQLLEYRKYQEAAKKLRIIETLASGMYTREAEIVEEVASKHTSSNEWLDLNISELIVVYSRLLQKIDDGKEKDLNLDVVVEQYSVEEQIDCLEALLMEVDSFSFQTVFKNPLLINNGELIATFLALLELTRQGKIVIRQKQNFQEIRIFKASTTTH